MTIMRHSGASRATDAVEELTDEYLDASNLEYFARAFALLAEHEAGNGGRMAIGLVGERDLMGVCLRQAQAAIRFDQRPSKWSHAFLIAEPAPDRAADLAQLKVLEVTMNPRNGTMPDPNSNGLTIGRLGTYASPVLTPNVALLAVRMTDDEAGEVERQARHPNRDRIRYNLWECLAVWQGYFWAQGSRPNPLGEGFPIFSSSYVEYAFEGIRLDLTPNASERNSTPEHLWNAVRYWHENLQDQQHSVVGSAVIRDQHCSLLYQNEIDEATAEIAALLAPLATSAGEEGR